MVELMQVQLGQSRPPARQCPAIADRVIVIDCFEVVLERLAADRDPLLDDERRLRSRERISLDRVRGVGQLEINAYLNQETLLMAMLETPEAIANAAAIAAVEGIDVLHIGSSDLSTEMGIPGQYRHERMRQAYEATARAARTHGKSMGVGGVREDFEFQSWLFGIGVRYLTGGSDVGYILSAGRADVKRLREVRLTPG